MATKTFKYFDAGIGFKDQAADNGNVDGQVWRNGAKLKAYIEGAVRELVTESQTQTLTNKTIDGSVNSISNVPASALTGIIDTDLNSVSGSHDTIPSAKATKDYIDQQILTEDEASEIAFTPAGSIAATNVQAAVEEVSQDVTDHLNDTVDAHDASAISNIPSGNLAATDLQSAVNELQSDIDTRALASGLSDHLSDAVDAHDASAISSVASGNLAATDVQTALNELQSDIDLRALTTNGSIITPTRLDVKQDTKANLITYALTATNGQVVFATDSKEYLSVVDNTLSSLGGGTGSLTSIFQLKADELISTWSTGNNATFLTAGSIAGTFVYETSTPLHGAASYKYTQAAGSLNDWFASAAQSVDLRFRGQQTFLSFPYQYNGNTSDIQVILYDVTNSAILNPSEVIVGNNGATSNTIYSVIIPLTCASIRVGFQVKVLNSGKIFSFDDLQLGSNVADFGNIKTTDVENIEATGFSTSFGSTNTGVGIFTISKNTNLGIVKVDSDSVNGTKFTALKDCTLNVVGYFSASGGTTNGYITKNSTVLISGSLPDGILAQPGIATTTVTPASVSVKLVAGDVIRFQRSSTVINQIGYITLTATADNNATASPTQQVSSDTMSFNFKATAINPATDAIGTFNTYTYTANNTKTIAASAPTQTILSMNINGIQLFGKAFNASSNAASPARVEIFIGKGLKSKNVEAYAASGKTTNANFDLMPSASNSRLDGTYVSYNETTGILILDAAYDGSGASTTRFVFSGESANTNGYFVFNASKSPSLVTIPNLAPRIATLSDVKTSGTVGGTGSTSFITRALNTLVDPTGIVTSLAANQFVLTAGEYYIEATCPIYSGVAAHKAKIRNVTDSTDALIGSSAFSTTSQGSFCNIVGVITITSSKTFEIQHRMQASLGTNDLGQACSFGINEVYSQLKITKVK